MSAGPVRVDTKTPVVDGSLPNDTLVKLGIVRAAIAGYRAAVLLARREAPADMLPLLQAQDLAATQIWDQIERLVALDAAESKIDRLVESRVQGVANKRPLRKARK